MRIGDARPRLNGTRSNGIGAMLTVTSAGMVTTSQRSEVLDQIKSDWQNWASLPADHPDKAGGWDVELQRVIDDARQYCTYILQNADPNCSNIESLARQVGASYQASAPAPAPLPQQPAQQQYTYQSENALDRTAPQQRGMPIQRTGTNALVPPSSQQPVQQTQTFGGTQQLTQRPGEEQQAADSGVPSWVWLLAAGAGVFMLMQMQKGRHS